MVMIGGRRQPERGRAKAARHKELRSDRLSVLTVTALPLWDIARLGQVKQQRLNLMLKSTIELFEFP